MTVVQMVQCYSRTDVGHPEQPTMSNLYGGVPQIWACDIQSRNYVAFAKRILAARSKAFLSLPRNLFRDEAWDMMLELYIAEHEYKNTLVKHLLLLSPSMTAGMRRIDGLEGAGLIVRSRAQRDYRCVIVHLTERGRMAIGVLLQDLDQSSQ